MAGVLSYPIADTFFSDDDGRVRNVQNRCIDWYDNNGSTPALQTVKIENWVRLRGCQKLKRVRTNWLSMIDCRVSQQVTTGDRKLFLKNCDIGVVVTTSREIQIINCTIGKLVIHLPQKKRFWIWNTRTFTLINSTIKKIVVYWRGNKIDFNPLNSKYQIEFVEQK